MWLSVCHYKQLCLAAECWDRNWKVMHDWKSLELWAASQHDTLQGLLLGWFSQEVITWQRCKNWVNGMPLLAPILAVVLDGSLWSTSSPGLFVFGKKWLFFTSCTYENYLTIPFCVHRQTVFTKPALESFYVLIQSYMPCGWLQQRYVTQQRMRCRVQILNHIDPPSTPPPHLHMGQNSTLSYSKMSYCYQ
jgi:hypothetical protein